MFKRRRKIDTEQVVPLSLTGTMVSHVGCVREVNEDTVAYLLPEASDPVNPRGLLALVADGMGGHAAGEVASRIAAHIVVGRYHELDGSPSDALAACLAEARIEQSVSAARRSPLAPEWALPARCWRCATAWLISRISATVAPICYAIASCARSARIIRSWRSWFATARSRRKRPCAARNVM